MPSRALVVDANIVIRAVLGTRVRQVIEANAGETSFLVPEAAFAEAEEHLEERPAASRGFTRYERTGVRDIEVENGSALAYGYVKNSPLGGDRTQITETQM